MTDLAKTGRNQPTDASAVIWLVVCCATWGVSHPLVKVLVGEVSPILAAALRSILAAAGTYAYGKLTGQLPPVSRRLHLHGMIIGVIFGVEFILLFWGIKLTLASRGGLLLYTQPFFTALLAHYFIPGDRINFSRAIGLTLSFGGAGVVLLTRPETGQASLVGDLMAVAAGLGWAVCNVYIRRVLADQVSFVWSLFWEVAWSIPVLLLGMVLFEEVYFKPTGAAFSILAFQGLVVTCTTYLIWVRLLYRYKASALASFTFLAPVAGVFFSGIFLGDPLTPSLLIGLALVSAGVWLVNRK